LERNAAIVCRSENLSSTFKRRMAALYTLRYLRVNILVAGWEITWSLCCRLPGPRGEATEPRLGVRITHELFSLEWPALEEQRD
jgi:hypothetical protein